MMSLPAVETACARIAPLWPLSSFVAVNPFLGLADMEFTFAARYLEHVAPGSLLPDAPPRGARLLTVADWLDRTRNTDWASVIVEEISKWCASYFDQGQAAWPLPGRDLGLYGAWKSAAALDANPEFHGLPAFRRFVDALPDDPGQAVEQFLGQLAVPEDLAATFLHRELMSIHGWSAYAAFHDWQTGDRAHVRQLLAIRLAYDAALAARFPGWHCRLLQDDDPGFDQRLASLLDRELAFRRPLARHLQAALPPSLTKARPALQAIFCIDVRSEALRRGLEAQSPAIETHGFAGFFGLALQVDSTARCPVLLPPACQVELEPRAQQAAAAGVWDALRMSVAAAFPAVETLGIAYAAPLFASLLPAPTPPPAGEAGLRASLTTSQKVDWAVATLRHLSLDPSLLASTVLICGHGSRSRNNPHAASLDCGACGGHPGDLNARLAAAILNEPAVRQGLAQRGLRLPADTVFVAGLHDTTTDEVRLFDAPGLNSATRASLEAWLAAASEHARHQRQTTRDEALRRAADWSEVRPEWGLANNAAFIAAPRWRTAAADLAGRAFLHDYDFTRDLDSSVLTLILTAPVVVASWINLQYFASTVNPALYGSGSKVLHNVVGQFGVCEGNGGDLRTGLPLQSLHDGRRWIHEPLRLQVFIDVPRFRLAQVLAAQPSVARLARNGWICLHAIDDGDVWQWTGGEDPWRLV